MRVENVKGADRPTLCKDLSVRTGEPGGNEVTKRFLEESPTPNGIQETFFKFRIQRSEVDGVAQQYPALTDPLRQAVHWCHDVR